MTLPVATSEIKRLYDAGGSLASISRELNVSVEVVRARLLKAGYKPRQRRTAVTKEEVRAFREAMPTLVALQQFLEGDRRELTAWMGTNPPRDKLERLGSLTDFINTLEDLTR